MAVTLEAESKVGKGAQSQKQAFWQEWSKPFVSRHVVFGRPCSSSSTARKYSYISNKRACPKKTIISLKFHEIYLRVYRYARIFVVPFAHLNQNSYFLEAFFGGLSKARKTRPTLKCAQFC